VTRNRMHTVKTISDTDTMIKYPALFLEVSMGDFRQFSFHFSDSKPSVEAA
jgi:hypothetical protein